MASTARPMPPALCACGCNEELPAVRPPKMRYLNVAHRERVRRRTEHNLAYQRTYQLAWYHAHAPRILRRRRDRQPVLTVTARPLPVPAGLVTTRSKTGWQLLSGWREDAAQDRVLRELERAVRRAS